MLLGMARRETTIHGITGLVEVASGWYTVLDSDLQVKYSEILEGEPGAILAPRLELHQSHLPLLPGWGGNRKNLPPVSAPPQPLSVEWWNALRPYQLAAVDILRSRRGSLLTDDLGAGKSRTALAAVDYPILIFCPKSAVIVWEDECAFGGLKFVTLSGLSANTRILAQPADAWILPWSIAGAWAGFFASCGMGPRVRAKIGDEIHEIQKGNTHAAKAWKLVDTEQALGLTATPIRNRLRSLWSLLDGVQPKAWGTLYDFRRRYCGAEEGEYGLQDGQPAPEDLDRLQRRLECCVIKRTREELRLDIPPLERRIEVVPLENSKKLEIMREAMGEVSGDRFQSARSSGVQLAWATELRKKIGMIKAEAGIPMIRDLTNSWGRAVLWVWHHEVADYLETRLREDCWFEVDKIVGSTTDRSRKKILREWRDGELKPSTSRVLIASIGACSSAVAFLSTGLAIFVEQDWAPLQMIQAEKRTHRPFQRREKCLSVYLTTGEGTIDHHITKILVEKAEEAEALLGRDGQLDQMRVILGVDAVESDQDFMARVAERIRR